MRYLLLLILFISCSRKNYVDVLSKPNDNKLDPHGRIMKTTGQENKKRYLYYNSIQYKNKHKREN
jgi:hypothetical protein